MILKKSNLTDDDKHIAQAMAGTIVEKLHTAPEVALLSLHQPINRMHVLRLALELEIAAIDEAILIEQDEADPLSGAVN